MRKWQDLKKMIDKSWEQMKMLEVKAWKKGVLQYLLDHSTPTASGTLAVQFYIRDEENFWWRVNQRMQGRYKVVQSQEVLDRTTYLIAKKRERGFISRLDVVEHQIVTKGSCKDKIVLYLYKKIRDYLTNYENKDLVLK